MQHSVPDLIAMPRWECRPDGLTYGDAADVAVDAESRVYVLTRMDASVVVYDADGTYLSQWGVGEFSTRPHGVTLAPDGTVYIVDEGDCSVRHFTSDGRPLGSVGPGGAKSDTGVDWTLPTFRERMASVDGGPPFNHPTRVAIAPHGDLFVSDGYGNARIHHFTADGELVHSWGRGGSGPGEFRIVHALAITDDGRVLVADRENDRIQVFSLDGTFIEAWLDVQRPTAIVIDAAGLIYVAELARSRGHHSFRTGVETTERPAGISILDRTGQKVGRLGSTTAPGTSGGFLAPHGLAIDLAGDLYVAETPASMLPVRLTMGDDIDPTGYFPTVQKLVRPAGIPAR